MLVVMENWDVHSPLALLLHNETLGGLDVLQVDAPEGGFQRAHNLNQLERVRGLQLNVKGVQVCKLLEEHGLAFHDGFGSQGTDVTQPEDSSTVSHHAHQMSFGGVLVDLGRVCLDLQAGLRHSGRVSNAQVRRASHVLGRHNLQLALAANAVVSECPYVQKPFAHIVPVGSREPHGLRGGGRVRVEERLEVILHLIQPLHHALAQPLHDGCGARVLVIDKRVEVPDVHAHNNELFGGRTRSGLEGHFAVRLDRLDVVEQRALAYEGTRAREGQQDVVSQQLHLAFQHKVEERALLSLLHQRLAHPQPHLHPQHRQHFPL
mmetsp:Transcript_24402/g.33613  ORF Transcript_24402/g.33613 Transcript_24402/m.33613 type:complete len:320 (-) Transcript_24402:847-1806(-)